MNTKPRLHSPTLLLRARLRRLEYALEAHWFECEEEPCEAYSDEWNARLMRVHDIHRAIEETMWAIERRKYRRGKL